MLGHVDHGKTSITKCLTGKWTDTDSEELKRGISIRIGYADATFRRCPKCKEVEAYTVAEKCAKCGEATKVLRKVSFLDAPGHETLMTTAIAASSIMDGAVLVIAANEECPQPQSLEHLMVLEVLGVKNIVVVQNKVDLVSKEKAVENYSQIQKFLKGTVAENAPIVPFVANKCANADALMRAIDKAIPTPERNLDAGPKMYVARSFDINKPGTEISKLTGGVIGGSLIEGILKVGEEVELRPGLIISEKGKMEKAKPLKIKVESLFAGGERIEEARPGGLIGIGTLLDPAVTKSDRIVGSLLGRSDELPPLLSEVVLEFKFLNRVGMAGIPIKAKEPLVLSIGTATAIGFVNKIKKNALHLSLKRPICILKGSKVAVSRRVGKRWRLAGYGTVKE
ncbi:translation initiation factor IF-2 subunit gamma [Candidatus Micrarchaeota archaeon]|nr:MAG: translation initiation factor IF-2 subunit gamma [Candidatus Micrarchaeota archaeon]